jgi:hypothetical protein
LIAVVATAAVEWVAAATTMRATADAPRNVTGPWHRTRTAAVDMNDRARHPKDHRRVDMTAAVVLTAARARCIALYRVEALRCRGRDAHHDGVVVERGARAPIGGRYVV